MLKLFDSLEPSQSKLFPLLTVLSSLTDFLLLFCSFTLYVPIQMQTKINQEV